MQPVQQPGAVLAELGLEPAPKLHAGELVVLGVHARQSGALFAHEHGNAVRVQTIALARSAHAAPALRGPSPRDLVHLLALLGQELGQATPEIPSAFDCPDPLGPLPCPIKERAPVFGIICDPPRADRSRPSPRDRLMQSFVCVDADPDHPAPPSDSVLARRRPSTRLTWVSRRSPIKSD